MAMQALKDGASSGILKFFLLGLLALAGGGLVFTDVGGFFRGGTGSNNVAKVAGTAISLQNFDLTLRRNLSQLGITPSQAHQLGYTNEVLRGEINRRLLIQAAHDSGINVDQTHALSQIQAFLAPAVAAGMTTEEALANLLRNQGMSEQMLLDTIRAERAVTLLGQGLDAATNTVNPLITEALYKHQNETRSANYLLYLDKDIETPASPSDDQLKQIYEATKQQFVIPETRDLTLLTLTTDALRKTLEVSEDEIRSTYEDFIDSYTTPAQRTFAQILFQSEEDANAAFDKLNAGENFDAIAKTGDLIPARAYEENTVLVELQAPVFEAQTTGTLAPIQTPLGWSIVNLTEISEERAQDFEDVKASIEQDIIEERLIDEIYRVVDEMDEFFISGGTAEAAIENFNLQAQNFEGANAFAQIPDISPENVRAAFNTQIGEAIPVIELDNGNFATLFVNNITEKAYRPFEDVKAEIIATFQEDQKAATNRQNVAALLNENAGKDLKTIAQENGRRLRTLSNVKRSSELESPLSQTAIGTLFASAKGDPKTVIIDGGIAILEVTDIELPKTIDEDARAQIETQALSDLQNETFGLYLNRLVQKHKVSINQGLLDRAYAQTSEEGF